MQLTERDLIDSQGDAFQSGRILSRLKEVSKLCGLILILAAGAVLIGWIYEDETLKRMSPGLVTMNPVTAIGFVLAGLMLCLIREEGGWPLWIAVGAWLLVAIGVVKLVDYAFGWTFHFDEVLFEDQLRNDRAATGNQIAPNTAINFILGGLALWSFKMARGRFSLTTQHFCVVLFCISSISLIGYLYGQHTLYRIAGRTPMAFHTSICFCLWALGLMLAQAEAGMIGLLAGRTTGSTSARRWLPFALGLPLVLGGFRLWAARHGWFSPEFGVALLIVGSSAFFAFLVWKAAVLLDRMDRAKQEAEARLKQAYEEIDLRLREKAAPLYAENEALQAQIALLQAQAQADIEKRQG